MKKILIVQRRLTHYRLPLFDLLRKELENKNIILELLVGASSQKERKKKDTGDLTWANKISTKYISSLCWMPFERYLKSVDLVIVTQENKLLYNHWLLMRPRSFRLAFWGHGRNMQSTNSTGFSERYKSWSSRRVDWWFAYNELSAKNVIKNRFPEDRITILENAVDTEKLIESWENVNEKEINIIKRKLKISSGPVGIYIGSLYKEKRIEFLIQTAIEIRNKINNFHLLIVGDGPDRNIAVKLTEFHPWIHIMGAKHGQEKVVLAKTADVLLNPGAVGLGVFDAFAFELPLITTKCGLHGPEIDYITNDHNGIITKNNKEDYVNAVLRVLRDEKMRKLIKLGCRKSAKRYTIKNMAKNFSIGIQKSMNVEKYEK